jgi:hypothetical protein
MPRRWAGPGLELAWLLGVLLMPGATSLLVAFVWGVWVVAGASWLVGDHVSRSDPTPVLLPAGVVLVLAVLLWLANQPNSWVGSLKDYLGAVLWGAAVGAVLAVLGVVCRRSR